MSTSFNYRHLYYFWVVAKEGGVARAADRLGVAVQTVSTQVRELERALGQSLLRPVGRKLVLTEAGGAAAAQAELIFALGEELPAKVREAVSTPRVRLAVGISDGLPKLVVHRLLRPVLAEAHLRLICHEGEFEDLLADLALHRLDVVFADRPAPQAATLKVYSHSLGSAPLVWYAPARLAGAARRGFPASLAHVPVLLPTPHSAVRALLDQWFEREAIRPNIAGEFEDSALLKIFGAAGMGVFAAAESIEPDLTARYGVKRVGVCRGVSEPFFAIGNERKVHHPLVTRVLRAHHRAS